MQQGQINVQTENIFPIIKKFLYSDHEIFLRELVSNAVDATQKRKALIRVGEIEGNADGAQVHVILDILGYCLVAVLRSSSQQKRDISDGTPCARAVSRRAPDELSPYSELR